MPFVPASLKPTSCTKTAVFVQDVGFKEAGTNGIKGLEGIARAVEGFALTNGVAVRHMLVQQQNLLVI